MKTAALKETIKGFGFKQWFLLALNVVLTLACIGCAVGLHQVSGAPETTTAARRFSGESGTRFAQLACYLPVGQGKSEEDIFEFRQGLDSKFMEQSLEAPENGSLYVDAYSAGAKVTVTTDYGTAQLTATGVGGDFFYFHPLTLRSGSYISQRDLMDDLVVLDEVLAWRLFGGVELTGMTVFINGEPFLVSGVVTMEDDFASERARTQEGALFLSYSALERLTDSADIDCYEIVLPDPITGYARGILEDGFAASGGEIVENSSRFSLSALKTVAGSFGERSMRVNGVIYPYWENALRLREDYAVLLLVLAVLFALCPAAFAAVFAVRWLCRGWRYAKRTIPARVSTAVEQRRERAYDRVSGEDKE